MACTKKPWIALALVFAAGAAAGCGDVADAVDQDTFWTITRPDAAATYRLVAYGDSILAGYHDEIFSVAQRAAPYVAGEYLSQRWGANVEVVRRTRSGARAADIYNDKIRGELAFAQDPGARVVMVGMCGNDYLEARARFAKQTGTCDTSQLDQALADCTLYMEKAMQALHEHATRVQARIFMNLYYPGYDADDFKSLCHDATTGQPIHRQSLFLSYLARSNWRACDIAARHGFSCADVFAEFMGADFDSDSDGQVDSAALAFLSGEGEEEYVHRIVVTLRATIHDAHRHFINAVQVRDYLQGNNIHPTYHSAAHIEFGMGGEGRGSGPALFTTEIEGGKNPEWNQWGHERLGWKLSTFHPDTP